MTQFNAELLKQNIPQELKDKTQWVRYVLGEPDINGKRSKIPYQVSAFKKADTTNPATWGTFDEAIANVSNSGNGTSTHGIGYVFAGDYVGVDLDNHLTPEGLSQYAKDLITAFETYTEISVSGTGIHLICKGIIPKGYRNKTLNVEAYMKDRFFTFTGNLIAPDVTTIEACQPQLDKLIEELAPKGEASEFITIDDTNYVGNTLPLNIKVEAARNHIAGMDAAVSGNNGSDALLKVCSVLIKGYALPYDEAFKLAQEYNKRCVPPTWTDKEIDHKLSAAQMSTISLGVFLLPIFAEENRKQRALAYEKRVDKLEENAKQIPDNLDPVKKFFTLKDILTEYDFNQKHYKTSFDSFDSITDGGLTPGTVVVMVGSPGSGKTTWAMQIADYISQHQPSFVSAFLREEGRLKGSSRILSFNGVDVTTLFKGDMSERTKAEAVVSDFTFYNESTPDACFADFIMNVVENQGDKQGIVIVDSIQVVSLLKSKDNDPRKAMVALMNSAQQAAQRYNLIIFLISQATRSSYASSDPNMRTKGLAAGSESSNIEYQADFSLHLIGDSKQPVKAVEVVKARSATEITEFYIKLDRPTRTFQDIASVDAEQAINRKQKAEYSVKLEKQETESITLMYDLLRFISNHPTLTWQQVRPKFRSGTPDKKKATAKNRAIEEGFLEETKKKGTGNSLFFTLTQKYIDDKPVTMESLDLDNKAEPTADLDN